MTEFHLGIIGGCSSHQHNTPLNALYHRQLAELLAADPGVRLRPHVVRAFNRSHVERLDLLLAGPPVDAVMVHVRMGVAHRSRLVVSRWENGTRRQYVHPALFRRGHSMRGAQARPGDDAAATEASRQTDAYGGAQGDTQDLPPPGRRIAAFRLRNLNYLVGTLAGLDRWEIEEDMLGLDAMVRACEDRGVPLIVLGPTPAAYSYWTQLVIRRTNAAIRRRLTGTGVPFASIDDVRDPEGQPLTRADGLHLTLAGHRYMAERLYEAGVREMARHQRAPME